MFLCVHTTYSHTHKHTHTHTHRHTGTETCFFIDARCRPIFDTAEFEKLLLLTFDLFISIYALLLAGLHGEGSATMCRRCVNNWLAKAFNKAMRKQQSYTGHSSHRWCFTQTSVGGGEWGGGGAGRLTQYCDVGMESDQRKDNQSVSAQTLGTHGLNLGHSTAAGVAATSASPPACLSVSGWLLLLLHVSLCVIYFCLPSSLFIFVYVIFSCPVFICPWCTYFGGIFISLSLSLSAILCVTEKRGSCFKSFSATFQYNLCNET